MSWSDPEYMDIRKSETHGQMGAFARKFIPADTLLGVYSANELNIVPIKSDGSLDLDKFGIQFNDIVQICRFKNNIICLGGPDEKENWTGIDYLNHSCKPNCIVKSSLQFWSLVDIEKGSELFHDYRTTDIIPEGIQCWCDTDEKCTI